MEDTTKVLELLDELEETIEQATSVPITNKVIIEPNDIYDIIKDIRLALPEDLKQAQWIREQKDAILEKAKNEYERIVVEAEKQAEYLVDTNEITDKARKMAKEELANAEVSSRVLKMKTYDYVDRLLYDMQGKMDELNMKYFGEMYTNLEHTFTDIAETLNANRQEIKAMAVKTQKEGLEGEQ